jgi:isopropylmalate/homocitrate/citramalate synthase
LNPIRYSYSTQKPLIGENVFTQVAGVHADGDNKEIFTLMICFRKDWDVKGSMLWEKLPAKQIFKKIFSNWVLISMKKFCEKSPNA